MSASGPRQTTIEAVHENVAAMPTTTPTNAAADAQKSGSRSSFAGGTSRVGSLVVAVACTGDSLLKPHVEAPSGSLLTQHRGKWNSRKFAVASDSSTQRQSPDSRPCCALRGQNAPTW